MKISLKTKFFNSIRALFRYPAMEKLVLLFTINAPYNSARAKLAPNNYQYRPGTWRYAKRNGINYKLDLHDYIDWYIFFGLAEESRNKLYSLAKQNAVVIDIGTNIGETLMNFSVLVGPRGHVHGFEPDSVNYGRCVTNLGLNSFSNIKLNKLGLGNKAGEFRIKVNTPSNRGGNKITAESGDNTEIIKVITLDEYTQAQQMDKVDLMKIDVEGFEYNILLGAEKTLDKFKPVLFIELDDDNLKEQETSAKALVDFVIKKGYSVINSENGQSVNTLTNFDKCHFDIICKFGGPFVDSPERNPTS